MGNWQDDDYSQQPKLLKCNQPFLIFSMQLDTPGHVITSLNQGRLVLYDYDLGYIHRWVATSSFDGRQNLGDWERTGGIHPPNYQMPGAMWFDLNMNLIKQPGQPVDEGYIVYYKKSNNFKTLKGNNRSQIMVHADKNWTTNPGSYGCIVFKPNEWEDFKRVMNACCGHLDSVRYGIMYTFQP